MDWESLEHSYHDPHGLLTSRDILFIHAELGADLVELGEIVRILEETDLRQDILDSRCLSDKLLESRKNPQLLVSEYFYYSTISRRILLDAGLTDLHYAEQVSCALLKISNSKNKQLLEKGEAIPRYHEFQLRVIVSEVSPEKEITILGMIEPYRVVLEGCCSDSIIK